MNRSVTRLLAVLCLIGVPGLLVSEVYYGTTLLGSLGFALIPATVVAVAILAIDDRDVFSPLYWLLYLLVVSVFGKTLYLMSTSYEYAQLVSLDGRDLEILTGGFIAMSIGAVAFALGYTTIRGRTRRPSGVRPTHPQVEFTDTAHYNSGAYQLFLTVCFLLSLICLARFSIAFDLVSELKRGVIIAKRVHEETVGNSLRGSSFGYLRWGAVTLPQVVVLATFVIFLHKRIPMRRAVKWLVAGLAIISLVIPLLTSARLELMYLFVMLGAAWHYYRRPISLVKITTLGLALILATSLLGYARYAQRATSGSASFSLAVLADKTMGSAYFMDIGKTSVIVDTVPDQVPYQLGSSYALFLLAPIPRTLWPEKPNVRISSFVGDQIYTRADDSGVPPGFVGEAYLNFGHVGVFVMMGLLGALSARIYRSLVVQSRRPLARLWYIFFVIVFAFSLLSGDFTLTVSQAGRYGLVLFLIDRVLFRREMKAARRPRSRTRSGARRPQPLRH